ncbi:hypothetical protein BH09BAC4_BH09BAC4_23610 [soil metagenome]
MEHCIVYVSSLISLLKQADLASLLEQSRSHNASIGITGILFINRGSILQVLEGKKELIEALYQHIEKDQRHTNLIKIADCPIRERSFRDWSMECKAITAYQLALLKTIVGFDASSWLADISSQDEAERPLSLSEFEMLLAQYKRMVYEKFWR